MFNACSTWALQIAQGLFFYPYGLVPEQKTYSQFVILELPDSSPIDILFNPDILQGWAFSGDNEVNTKTVIVGADTFILATIAKPITFLEDGKYYVRLYNKIMGYSKEYNYDPAKDATIPIIEYELIRGVNHDAGICCG